MGQGAACNQEEIGAGGKQRQEMGAGDQQEQGHGGQPWGKPQCDEKDRARIE